MKELFLNDQGLIEFSIWESLIQSLQQNIKPTGTKDQIKQSLITAVKKRAKQFNGQKIGLMLSGGVDSSVIALLLKQAGVDFCCYTVGIEGANDLAWAQKVAKELGVQHKHKTLSIDDVDRLIKKLHIIFSSESRLNDQNQAVLYGVACVELGCIELAAKDNVTHFFGGLGSEEIFAGYQRHDDSSDINAECWKGLIGMHSRDLIRDCTLATSVGITVSTPFLDRDLIVSAMSVPDSVKIKDGVKKHILREIAEELGLSKDIAWRKKQAAQYGSRIDKAISKLAKLKGFEYKREYLDSL